MRLIVFHTGKVFTLRPWKFPEIHTGTFDRMDSALQFPTLFPLPSLLTTSLHGQGSTKNASEERGPNQEADQLVSNKRGQGVELGSTVKHLDSS